jgi:hypothetical protein
MCYLDSSQPGSFPLNLVDGLGVANDFNDANLRSGSQACVWCHPQVHALRVPDVVHDSNDLKSEHVLPGKIKH